VSVVWSHEAALERIRPRLWNYLRSHAAEYEIGSFVENIFNLPRRSFESMVATHLSLSDLAAQAIDAIDEILPRLPSSIVRHEEELVGLVHGPIDWTQTTQRRISTGDPTLFVCRPAARRYDTPPARLCARGIGSVLRVTAASGVSTPGPVASSIAQRRDHAMRLRKHPKLASVRSTAPLRRESIARICNRRPALHDVAVFIERVESALDQHDPAVVEEVVMERLLAPADSDDLFELEVAFSLLDALEAAGFQDVTTPDILGDASRELPLARVSSPVHGPVSIWWEKSFWKVHPAPPSTGLLHEVLANAEMRQQPFRPDLILNFEGRQQVIVVEVKATEKGGVAAERRGIQEAFAYLLDAHAAVSGKAEPHALVVAWNATGKPRQSRVVVADQHGVAEALDLVLKAL
jgi:hypothetical protein